jgi:hypothetical protein
MSNRHPKIVEQARMDGFSQHDDVDFQTFSNLQQAKFFMNGPTERMRALNAIDEAISADDGSSMRAKSVLFRLRNELSAVHEKLLKASR